MAASPPDPPLPFSEIQGGFSKTSPKTSPTMAYRRPVRPANGYQSFGTYMESSPERPGLVASPINDPRYPPPPHLAQPHYYKAPELDMSTSPFRAQEKSSTPTTCRLFDTFVPCHRGARRAPKDVLICGYSGSVDVFTVSGYRISPLITLNNLRGSVSDAKILPWTGANDPWPELRPLMAMVVHGPCENTVLSEEPKPGSSHSESGSINAPTSTVQPLNTAEAQSAIPSQQQTTVEVYSLRTKMRISTLIRGPETAIEALKNNQTDRLASSNLQIQASERFVAVGSGISGEVFLFEYGWDQDQRPQNMFQCIGKVWTRTFARKDRASSVSSSASEPDHVSEANRTSKARLSTALFSLSNRWLAIVPPPSSSGTSLHFRTDLVGSSRNPPGITSHAAPSEPHITCNLDTPDAENKLNKVARDLTQEVFRGAQWLGNQGLQAWNTYWTKSGERISSTANATDQLGVSMSPQADLPPTHANRHVQAPTRNAQSVAFLDLPRIATSQHVKPERALQPIATFSPPYECSFLSFAPSGLSILISSKKGDVHQIWDLMSMVHGNTLLRTDDREPLIREVVRFTRMTIARIIDIQWAEPKGERLAIVTDKGTAHIYDVPSTAFQWPPPRRKARPSSAPGTSTTTETNEDHPDSTPAGNNSLGARMTAVANKAQPLFSAVRGRPIGVGSTFAGYSSFGFPINAGMKGSKVMAAGLRQSVGAAAGTVSSFRHLGENRISLPGANQGISHGCIRWLSGKHVSLAVHGSGIVKIHRVHQSSREKPAKRRPSVLGSKPHELAVPGSAGPANGRPFSPTYDDHPRGPLPKAMWPASPPTAAALPDVGSRPHPLSSAEIETNAPYQPFHADPRVSFHISRDDDRSGHLGVGDRWIFGENIPSTRVSIGTSSRDRHDPASPDIPTAMESFIDYEGNLEQGQQILVSTRRRRLREGEAVHGGEEGDFFDDDCAVVDFADSRV